MLVGEHCPLVQGSRFFGCWGRVFLMAKACMRVVVHKAQVEAVRCIVPERCPSVMPPAPKVPLYELRVS